MDIISVALKRHSTKAFDASKKLTPEQAEQIKTLLQYSPSSTNSQPWHFIVASTEEGKARVAKSAAGNYVFNERKILDASHVVVFCAKTAMDDAWLKLVVDQEDADGRFATPEAKAANDKGRKFFADMHRKDLHDDAEWMAKQVYLNVGNFLLGVAALGLDAVPIEGFDAAILDAEFGLKEKVLMISLLIGQSPAILISGLGAMAAVLMLVFKDPILGLVAGIQLSANDMLKLGDWLEMPKYGADGAVIDIGLTTVKVRNWDNTITTIPTWSLVSDSFKNWSGMSASGGRRIKRSISIDVTSIRFLDEDEMQRLNKAHLLKPYLTSRHQEINEWNRQQGSTESILNLRRMTNIGTFRAYLNEYLRNHPRIRKDMTLMVRQLAPGDNGLPLEIYAFTNTVVWLEYESIQADIFDHIFAIVEEFGLRLHQSPTGNDIRSLAGAFKQ